MKKTKIICTMGPALEDDGLLRELMLSGMNVARLNFSHGDHEEHLGRVERIKALRSELDVPVALLLDTKGPEIRTGNFNSGRIELTEGSVVTLLPGNDIGDEKTIYVSYHDFYQDIDIGSPILIDDGLVELEVMSIDDSQVKCRVLNGGPVSNHKSINLPGAKTNLPALTSKDIEDIRFAIEHDFDFIAASFVRKAADVLEIKKILEKYDGESIHIIAKIENREGISNFDEILKVADGIMVARGDLGVEIPMQEVPTVQKALIEKCYKIGKPCITATQMLDSMMRNPRPTRAEVSDVANAILDGTSAIMLSGETAAGKYPLESLKMMVSIAEQTEKSIDYWGEFIKSRYEMVSSVTNAISHATCMTAMDLKAAAIVAVTHSGRTARLISRFRPECPIIATTVSPMSYRQLALSWGVYPYLVEEVHTTDAMFELGMSKALESGRVKNGDVVVITGGTPIGMSGTTNTLKVQNIGRILVDGKGIGKGNISGEALVIQSAEDLRLADMRQDYILVASHTDNEMLPAMKKALALVVETTDPGNHAAIVGLALDIPILYACENATKILKTGSLIAIDVERGTIS
ncbi:MAG: pyruvate kinase [Eubacteriales bacterium]|nr:pyruvate kinase [Eubacteriales bacterium]MDD3198463.1 pyruvate kinase [Eubacteriales bacterium]MDD3502815.1 pyruvate kinase [Eubacteriales bacterium]MDD4683200.1 pyruvate kinase [Eubacteriales bacterium]